MKFNSSPMSSNSTPPSYYIHVYMRFKNIKRRCPILWFIPVYQVWSFQTLTTSKTQEIRMRLEQKIRNLKNGSANINGSELNVNNEAVQAFWNIKSCIFNTGNVKMQVLVNTKSWGQSAWAWNCFYWKVPAAPSALASLQRALVAGVGLINVILERMKDRCVVGVLIRTHAHTLHVQWRKQLLRIFGRINSNSFIDCLKHFSWIIFTTNELVDRIRNFKSNASQNDWVEDFF